MGYRVWNNYEEDAERRRQEHIAALPWQRRIILRVRLAAILLAVLAMLFLLFLRVTGYLSFGE